MKRKILVLLAGCVLLLGVTGCAEVLPNAQVESGVTDQAYEGDPAPVLDAQYRQSEEERIRYEQFTDEARDQSETEKDDSGGKGYV